MKMVLVLHPDVKEKDLKKLSNFTKIRVSKHGYGI